MFRRKTFSLALLGLFVLQLQPLNAATRTWVGGNDPWDTDIFNWSGIDEPDPDDDVVFNTNNHVEMAMDNEILSLDISNGLELDTETYFLDVNGEITLSDAGTILRVGENDLLGLPATSVSAYYVTVNNGATYANAGFTSLIHPSDVGMFDINSGGTLFGNGTIRSGDGIASPTIVLENDGVIRPGNVTDGFIFVGLEPPARTLTLAAVDSDARIDLDGVSGLGALDLQRNQTLDIDIELADDFDGTIDMAHNATLDVEDAWEFAGTLNVDNGLVPGQVSPFLIPEIPADVAYLQGGAITMNELSTTINVLDGDGTLQIDVPFTANEGTINNQGRIVFNQDATIGADVDFQMNGVDAGMTVGPGATVVVNDADMDFDGSGASTNEIIVEDGGLLDMNLDSFEGNDRADGFLTLNSGSLALNVTDGSWTMERRLTLNHNGTGTPVVSGSAMVVGDDTFISSPNDADVRVTGNGTSQIAANVTWNSDTEVDVEAGASLAVTGFSTFNSVNGAESAQFNGPGDIYFSGGLVNEATTLNFSGGTVGLDGGGGGVLLLGAPDFTVNAPLTINAAAMDSYGRTSVFPFPSSSELIVNNDGNDGTLSVNLDNPSDAWTINSVGVLNLVNGNGAQTLLFGSDLNMEGTMNVTGDVRSTARLDLSGTVNINTAGQFLRLGGGNTTTDPNTIAGATINGPGGLTADSDRALHGYGTISAPIDFGTGGELLANDGTLSLTGGILSGRVLGTADSDGVLNVTTGWNSNSVSQVLLNGGELTGSTVTNDNLSGIRGAGLITAPVINNTGIRAQGGNLTLENQTPSNLDGLTDVGVLRAETGDLIVSYPGNTVVDFRGGVRADAGHEFFGDRTLMDFASTSTLDLNGGTYRSNRSTIFGGSLDTAGGMASRVENPNLFRFTNTSSATLNGDLLLVGNTEVETGASFSGGGALVNTAGSDLQLMDGAIVNVLLENEGTLSLGSSAGQTTGLDFQQLASGSWDLEIGGMGLNDFDRMNLTGAAALDGELDLSLIMGFVPSLGDTFNVLSATGGVMGDFASLVQPAAMPQDLLFDVNYLGSLVQLEVIKHPDFTADFDNDGDVDADDLGVWESSYGSTGADANGDGSSNGYDFLAWQRQYGNGTLPLPMLAASAVPEPSTMLLAGLAVGCGLMSPRRSRR